MMQLKTVQQTFILQKNKIVVRNGWYNTYVQ